MKNKKKSATFKKLPKTWDKDTYLQVGAIMEDIQSNIRVLGENQSMMYEKWDGKFNVLIQLLKNNTSDTFMKPFQKCSV